MATRTNQRDPSASRRPELHNLNVHGDTHAGLWLDKYLTHQSKVPERNGDDPEHVKEARANLMRNVAETVKTPVGYQDLAKYRVRRMEAAPASSKRELRFYQTTGRMVVGLGEFSASEVGIQLERTWGTPVIPGSALKGLAASVAHRYTDDDAWNRGNTPDDKKRQSHQTLFGATDSGGKVTFHDAWWVPTANKNLPFAADIMTVHHKSYYTDANDIPAPDGTESPVPVSFLSVKPGTVFAIALEASAENQAWLKAAWDLLDYGLEQLGVGAKTSSGYGRLNRDTHEEQKRATEKQQQLTLLAFTQGTIDDQLKLIVEKRHAQLYNALREFSGGKKEAAQFWENIPKAIMGFPDDPSFRLAEVSTETFETALINALKADKEGWWSVLRTGNKPAHWQLSTGSSTLKKLGDAILGPRKDDTDDTEGKDEEQVTFTDEEQALLDNLRILEGGSKGALNRKGLDKAMAHVAQSENDEWLAKLIEEVNSLPKSLKRKERRKHRESIQDRRDELKDN